MDRKQSITLMRMIGRLAFAAARKEKEKTIRHLTWAFGDTKSPEEIRALASGFL